MPRRSAGILLYRRRQGAIEVLLAHPGGPFWARKDDGAWSIPKGEYGAGEDPLAAARREFREETGIAARDPRLYATYDLNSRSTASHFFLSVFRVEADADAVAVAADDAADLGWFTAEEISSLPAPESVRDCIRRLEADRGRADAAPPQPGGLR